MTEEITLPIARWLSEHDDWLHGHPTEWATIKDDTGATWFINVGEAEPGSAIGWALVKYVPDHPLAGLHYHRGGPASDGFWRGFNEGKKP